MEVWLETKCEECGCNQVTRLDAHQGTEHIRCTNCGYLYSQTLVRLVDGYQNQLWLYIPNYHSKTTKYEEDRED